MLNLTCTKSKFSDRIIRICGPEIILIKKPFPDLVWWDMPTIPTRGRGKTEFEPSLGYIVRAFFFLKGWVEGYQRLRALAGLPGPKSINSQKSHNCSQQSVASVPEDLRPSSDFYRH